MVFPGFWQRSGAGVMRWLLALIAILIAAPAAAGPSLDPSVHPYIALVSTDKAVYAPGVSGNIVVSLRNPSATVAFSGTLTTNNGLGNDLVGQVISSVTIPAGGTLTVNAPFFFAASTGERGYAVNAILTNGAGTLVDAAPGAIDVQNAGLPTSFPRQCWMSKHDGSINPTTLIASMVAWRCNTMQNYASYYKPELAPPPALSSWPTLSNLTVSRATINGTITAAHAVNMPVMFFQATGEAYNTWQSAGTGPSLAMGSFTRACSTGSPCTEADMDKSPPPPFTGWNSPPQNYGWQADHLDFFDLCNAAWQKTLINNSIRPMLAQFAFDGWQADTVGAPIGATYDINGRPINTGACLSDFTSGAQARLGKPVVVNNVSGWNFVDTALTGTQPYVYRETWYFETGTYAGLNQLLSSAYGIRRYTSRAVVTPGYLNQTLANNCAIGSTTSGCFANTNSARFATAAFAIAGSVWMNHNDDACLVTNVFVEGYQLPCAVSTVDALLAYKAFEVGYQNFLREAVGNAPQSCAITAGGTSNSTGAAGSVWVVSKSRPGMQICHLLNMTGLSANDWTDLNGTRGYPTLVNGSTVKMYYAGSPVTSGTNRLWVATPDMNNGVPSLLTYTTGSDGGGNYVTFTLPNLAIWDMVVLETSLTGTNLAVDVRKPVIGSWYAAASAGVSQGALSANAACCGRWVAYRNLQFGVTAPTTLSVTYGSIAASTMQFRLGGPRGAVISTCALPSTGSVSTTATVTCSPPSATTGIQDVYATFGDKQVVLYSFIFG